MGFGDFVRKHKKALLAAAGVGLIGLTGMGIHRYRQLNKDSSLPDISSITFAKEEPSPPARWPGDTLMRGSRSGDFVQPKNLFNSTDREGLHGAHFNSKSWGDLHVGDIGDYTPPSKAQKEAFQREFYSGR